MSSPRERKEAVQRLINAQIALERAEEVVERAERGLSQALRDLGDSQAAAHKALQQPKTVVTYGNDTYLVTLFPDEKVTATKIERLELP